MLHRLPPDPATIPAAEPETQSALTVYWQGSALSARPDDSVASALLGAGVRTTRHSAVSGAARLPFCMMGTCFECLLEVDGQIVQACLTPVRDGMQVRFPEQLCSEAD